MEFTILCCLTAFLHIIHMPVSNITNSMNAMGRSVNNIVSEVNVPLYRMCEHLKLLPTQLSCGSLSKLDSICDNKYQEYMNRRQPN